MLTKSSFLKFSCKNIGFTINTTLHLAISCPLHTLTLSPTDSHQEINMPQYSHSMKSLSYTCMHTSRHKQTVTTHCNYHVHCNMNISWIIQVVHEGAYHKSKSKLKLDLIINTCSSPNIDNALELYTHATSTPSWHGTYVQSQIKINLPFYSILPKNYKHGNRDNSGGYIYKFKC